MFLGFDKFRGKLPESRNSFWDAVFEIVESCRKRQGKNVSINEHKGYGSIISVNPQRQGQAASCAASISAVLASVAVSPPCIPTVGFFSDNSIQYSDIAVNGTYNIGTEDYGQPSGSCIWDSFNGDFTGNVHVCQYTDSGCSTLDRCGDSNCYIAVTHIGGVWEAAVYQFSTDLMGSSAVMFFYCNAGSTFPSGGVFANSLAYSSAWRDQSITSDLMLYTFGSSTVQTTAVGNGGTMVVTL